MKKPVLYVQDYWIAKKQRKEQIKDILLISSYALIVIAISYMFCNVLFTTI